MSNSLRFFTVSAGTSPTSVETSLNYRLGDNLPFNYALVYIPAGDLIPGSAIPAPAGGAYVLNTEFLPTDIQISAFARAATAADQNVVIAIGDSSAELAVDFDTGVVAKGLTALAGGAFAVENAGYYRVNVGLNALNTPNDRDVTLAVQTSVDAGATWTTVPQGTFTIIGCPTTEFLGKDVYTDLLPFDPLNPTDSQIRVLATLTAAIIRPIGSLVTDWNFNVGAGSTFETSYLGNL